MKLTKQSIRNNMACLPKVILIFTKLFTDGIYENELHFDDEFVLLLILFQHLI